MSCLHACHDNFEGLDCMHVSPYNVLMQPEGALDSRVADAAGAVNIACQGPHLPGALHGGCIGCKQARKHINQLPQLACPLWKSLVRVGCSQLTTNLSELHRKDQGSRELQGSSQSRSRSSSWSSSLVPPSAPTRPHEKGSDGIGSYKRQGSSRPA